MFWRLKTDLPQFSANRFGRPRITQTRQEADAKYLYLNFWCARQNRNNYQMVRAAAHKGVFNTRGPCKAPMH